MFFKEMPIKSTNHERSKIKQKDYHFKPDKHHVTEDFNGADPANCARLDFTAPLLRRHMISNTETTMALECGERRGFIRRTRGGDHGVLTVSFAERRSDVLGFHLGSGFRARFHFLLRPIEILLKEPRSAQSTQRDPPSVIHFTGEQLLPFEFPVPALLTAGIRLKSQKNINSHNLTTESFNK